MITGVNHITLAVRDLDRSFRFYVETLGIEGRWRDGAKGLTCSPGMCGFV